LIRLLSYKKIINISLKYVINLKFYRYEHAYEQEGCKHAEILSHKDYKGESFRSCDIFREQLDPLLEESPII
jgi:hypothetical protein